MWKFGVSSLLRCQYSVNFMNQRFTIHNNKKWTKKTNRYPSKKIDKQRSDPGLRRQARAFDPDGNFEEEDYENEVDILKFDKLYDQHQSFRKDHKETVKMKIVEQKYFKKPQEDKLSWSDKEHIRYLYNTDPKTWTFQMISEHFHVDPKIAKRIATAKWIPKQTKSSERDNQVTATQVAEFVRSKDLPDERRVKPYNSQEMITFAELQKSMGIEQKKEEEIGLKHEAEPMHNPKNDPKVDKLIQFFTEDCPYVWAEKESHPQSKVSVIL